MECSMEATSEAEKTTLPVIYLIRLFVDNVIELFTYCQNIATAVLNIDICECK